MSTLLITGTIKPLCNIMYNNPEIRLREYVGNIKRYIKESDFDSIIFAENSGYEFEVEELRTYAKTYHKTFEFLDFSSNCDKHNMSTGEAELLRQSIKNSELLIGESVIWKVSGRIYIENINKILKDTKKKCSPISNIFLYAPRYNSIQTWFFRMNTENLLEYFLTDESIAAMKVSCIEYVWMSIYKENASNIKIEAFKRYPNALGKNSSGNLYTVSKGKLFIRNILLKLGYYTVK